MADKTRKTVLVTGGAGFIGTHACVELLAHDYDVVVVDDFSNSNPVAVDRVAELAGRPVLAVHEVDVRDRAALREVFAGHPIDSVIHFAGKKAVGESLDIPIDYYDINLAGLTSVLSTMIEHEVYDLVFSSSCSIYGDTAEVPLTEDSPAAPTNPYARSKWMCEQILSDACARHPELAVFALRYFNPTGAHPSGRLGEDPIGVPNNVMPYLMQVGVGRRERLSVFGGDYPTPDGSCVRDYIHVVDVADGHRLALEDLDERGFQVLNLGTGRGTSVLELVQACSAAAGFSLPFEVVERRAGDVPALVADATKAEKVWGWRTRYDLGDMCADAWRFQQANPHGYQQSA